MLTLLSVASLAATGGDLKLADAVRNKDTTRSGELRHWIDEVPGAIQPAPVYN